MMTTALPYTKASLHHIATILKQGGVAIIPTDTVYGLVCHPDFPEALERIRQLKQRDRTKPFQWLMASVENVWADGAYRTAETEAVAAFWPGALTVVMTTQDGRAEGYRVPDDSALQTLLEHCGGALRATSVNISGEPPAVSLQDVPDTIRTAVDCIVDGGTIPAAAASTVIQITPENNIILLRSGALADHILAQVKSNE
ncbi:MAG: L-threonylcarbamoyladenylate synthase [Kiritimatiellae bacterium]|nr:L-threonylcarbamoyladenylate synthase [Kiritimatiellia bacterium]